MTSNGHLNYGHTHSWLALVAGLHVEYIYHLIWALKPLISAQMQKKSVRWIRSFTWGQLIIWSSSSSSPILQKQLHRASTLCSSTALPMAPGVGSRSCRGCDQPSVTGSPLWISQLPGSIRGRWTTSFPFPTTSSRSWTSWNLFPPAKGSFSSAIASADSLFPRPWRIFRTKFLWLCSSPPWCLANSQHFHPFSRGTDPWSCENYLVQ